MYSQSFLRLLALLTLTSIGSASPIDTQPTDNDPSDMAANGNFTLQEAGNSTLEGRIPYTCFTAPEGISPTLSSIAWSDCQLSASAFTTKYPPAATRADRWTLTHSIRRSRLARYILTPLKINPIPITGCDFIVNYKTYPTDKDYPDELNQVAEYGESLIRKCKRKSVAEKGQEGDRWYGGRMIVSFGSFEWIVTFKSEFWDGKGNGAGLSAAAGIGGPTVGNGTDAGSATTTEV